MVGGNSYPDFMQSTLAHWLVGGVVATTQPLQGTMWDVEASIEDTDSAEPKIQLPSARGIISTLLDERKNLIWR